jgi:hypothetical protein
MTRIEVSYSVESKFPAPLTCNQEQNREIQEIVSRGQDDAIKIDEIAKIRGWFKPSDDSAFYAIVQDFLAKKITSEEASEKMCTPIDEKISAQRLDDVNFTDLWYSIIHSARRMDYRNTDAHQTIVSLVETFKEHSVPNNEKYNYLYSSLTDFLLTCREAYNDQPIPGSSFDIEVTAWTNMNFFFALLTGKEIADNSYFAIWAMREALETPHSDDKESTAVQKYETYVPAAAAWAFGAFRVLFHKEEDLTPKDKKQGNPARSGELWKGKAEFSKARWNFWSERFAAIGKMEEINEATRIVARDAVQAMERAATFEKI